MDKEYILFCDESDRSGRYYSDFYGGVLVGSSQYERVTRRLQDLKNDLNLGKEVKWSRVSEPYLGKYMQLMSAFFEEIRAGHIKMRVMFRQNARQPRELSVDQRDRGYFLLYYQFIKHAFGFPHMPAAAAGAKLRIYFDEFPDKPDHAAEFRQFILRLADQRELRDSALTIADEDVQEVRSHDHVLLQCMDVVLGSMSFRLNDKHLEIAPGKHRRGKRTIAKEKLYKHILGEIREWKSGFNIGQSTEVDGDITNRWSHPYRHWAFLPSAHRYDEGLTKRKGSLKRR